MGFAEIRGQEVAIQTLQRAVNGGRVPHAYLFSGPPGVGKKLTGLALAQTLNCTSDATEACGECRNCRKAARSTHPDISVVTIPEGKKIIPIDEIRAMERALATPPYEGKAKVAIIDPADKMTEQAANALLKTLEEPRDGSFLILITTRAGALLPTVRSRCQLLRFRLLPRALVAEILQRQGISSEDAQLAAELSHGSIDTALEYADQSLDKQFEIVFNLLRGATEKTPLKGLQEAAALRGSRDEALSILNLLILVLSEILWLSTHRNEANEQQQQRVLVRRLGRPLIGAAHVLSTGKIGKFVFAAQQAIETITYFHTNAQLAVEGMLMTMRGRAIEIPGGK